MQRSMLAVAAVMLATGALAQNPQSSAHNPAVKDGKVHQVATPVKGHSSFTESQAKGRLAKAGYANVSDLKKTDDGFWQGSAMKGGRTVTVSLDYKGNVTAK